MSFEKYFNIDVKNSSGASCDSGSPSAPVPMSPVRAPVAPVPSPVLAPVPVRAPKGVPAPVPVSVPVTPIAPSPVAPSPVPAPTVPVTKPPVRAPVAPVPSPVLAPVPVRAPKGVPAPVPVSLPCSAQVTGYTLVNAESDRDIMPLQSYVMRDVPESLSIRVDIRSCSPKVVESVYIDFDGVTRCENNAPYTAFGDGSSEDVANNMADYYGKAIKAGHHVIKATPYTGDNCGGTAGKTHTLEFTVEEEIPYF